MQVLILMADVRSCYHNHVLKFLYCPGNQPQANVQFYTNDDIEQQFGRLSRIFAFISNYTKAVVKENAQFGVPTQRPLFMEFPNDTISWTITYQYMFGPDLLVAPVIQPNVTDMRVYLPPGQWKYIWDNVGHSGGQFVTVLSPIGEPPAFYRDTSRYSDMFSQILSKFPLPPDRGDSHTPSIVGKREKQ